MEMGLLILDRNVILEVKQDAHQAARSILCTNVFSLQTSQRFAVSFAETQNWTRVRSAIMATKLAVKIAKLAPGTNVIENPPHIAVSVGMASGKNMNSVIMAIKLAAEIVYSRLAIHVLGLKTVPQFVVSCLFAGTRFSM